MLSSYSLSTGDITLQKLSELINQGLLTSEGLIEWSLARAEHLSGLNALISLDGEGAIQRAKELDSLRAAGGSAGPLHGIPIVVKDNIHVAGLPNSAGTPALENFVPDKDASIVAKLKEAGAIVLGKANMHELAFGITSNNGHFGAVGNPHAPEKTAGGSSGGTGAALGAAIVPVGLGTDTGGSLRIPGSLNGICSHRPSLGRYSQQGITPLSHTRDTPGNMARNVSDLILLDSIVCDETMLPEIKLEQLRFGVPRAYLYSNLDPETEHAMGQALKRLREAGVTLVEADIPQLGELMLLTADNIVMYETVRELRDYLADFNTGVSMEQLGQQIASPDVKFIFEMITGEDAVEDTIYQIALEKKQELTDIYSRYFAGHELDAIVFPTTPVPARPHADITETVEINGIAIPVFTAYMRNTEPASIAGLPGISLPIPNVDGGMPIGLELDGPCQSDRKLLAIASVLEALLAA